MEIKNEDLLLAKDAKQIQLAEICFFNACTNLDSIAKKSRGYISKTEGFSYETFDIYHAIDTRRFLSTSNLAPKINEKNKLKATKHPSNEKQIDSVLLVEKKNPIINNGPVDSYNAMDGRDSNHNPKIRSASDVDIENVHGDGEQIKGDEEFIESLYCSKCDLTTCEALCSCANKTSMHKCRVYCKLCKVANELNWNVVISHDHSMLFKCKYCFFSTTMQQTFKNHVENEHESSLKGKLDCKDSNTACMDLSNIKKLHRKVKRRNCKYDSKNTQTAIAHAVGKRRCKTTLPKTKFNLNEFCKDNLRLELSQTKRNNYKCYLCEFVTTHQDSLKRHVFSIHMFDRIASSKWVQSI